MEDIQDLELCVELTPEELEELKGGDAVLKWLGVFPYGVPAILLERIQVVTNPVISNPITLGPLPDPWIPSQQISTPQ